MERHYVAWGPPVLSQRADTGRIVLAICQFRYRQGIGRINRAAAQAWLDGYDIPMDLVLAGFREEIALGNRDARSQERKRPDEEERADALAYGLARGPMAIAAMTGLGLSNRQAIIFELSEYLRAGTELSPFVLNQLPRLNADPQGDAVHGHPEIPISPISMDDIEDVFGEGTNLRAYLPTWQMIEPELGFGKIRSHSSRANRRAIAFISFVVLLRKMPDAYRDLMFVAGRQRETFVETQNLPKIIWS